MKKAIVTGCAGFIGSHLTEALLKKNYFVIGIDCFTDYYSKELKESNMKEFENDPHFLFIKKDVSEIQSDTPVFKTLKDIDTIYHLAAQAGVRASWGDNFRKYTLHTFESTQRILELAKETKPRQVIMASSSSVYGNETEMPLSDSWTKDLWPVSPYGVSKLAAEKLCYLYNNQFGVPVACLRFFTVFGPRQRPDMAFPQWIRQILDGGELKIYGTGKDMTRDYTYIDDNIRAMLAVAEKGINFGIFNVGSGGKNRVTILDVIHIIEKLTGKRANLRFFPKPAGDIDHTYANISKLKEFIGFEAKVGLEEGLRKQINWWNNTNNPCDK